MSDSREIHAEKATANTGNNVENETTEKNDVLIDESPVDLKAAGNDKSVGMAVVSLCPKPS